MGKRELLLETIRQRGAALPSELTGAIGENTILIGAMLSELVASKEVAVSNAKIGGSPLYYMPARRETLAKIRPHLNEKDRRVYDKLENAGILRDSEQAPIEQAGLRALKDFAIMLTVTIQGRQETFWRWHLLNSEEAKQRIQELFRPKATAPVQSQQEAAPLKEIKETPAPQQEKENIASREEKDQGESKPSQDAKTTSQKPAVKPLETPKAEQQMLDSQSDDEFFAILKHYLEKHDARVRQVNVLRPKREIEMIVDIKSGVGSLTYYAYAKKKKKCNDGDIAVAFVNGQLRHLPVLFLTTGELTKKTKEALATTYKGITAIEGVQ